MKNLFKKPTFLLAFLLVILFGFLDNQQLTTKNIKDFFNFLPTVLTPTTISTPTITPIPTLTLNPTINPTTVLGDNQNQPLKVKRVIDGDTIEIESGEKVRYIGINTPEIDDKDPFKLCLAQKAASKNKELVEGKEVILVKDISETDKYNRLLRYVYVDNIFINDFLVRQGFAQTSTYPPDVKFKEQFLEAEKEARENKRGLWSEECLTE